MFHLQSVTKSYMRHGHTVIAFQTEVLDIKAGEYVAVVGSSGSGKTTLLSMLGGMLSPTIGRVWLGEQSLYELPLSERTRIRRESMGFVFQTFNLIPYLTAIENVQVPLGLAGIAPKEQRERAVSLLEKFGLTERLNHKPSELSTGQQQRVALARTLANDPRIILADEPTGNLDPENRRLVLDVLQECHRAGRTIVMVTHDPDAAEHVQRRLYLCDGQVRDAQFNSAAKERDAA